MLHTLPGTNLLTPLWVEEGREVGTDHRQPHAGPLYRSIMPVLTNTPKSRNDFPTLYMREPRELAEGHVANEGQGQDSTGFLTLSLGLNRQKPRIQVSSPWPHKPFLQTLILLRLQQKEQPKPGLLVPCPGVRHPRDYSGSRPRPPRDSHRLISHPP